MKSHSPFLILSDIMMPIESPLLHSTIKRHSAGCTVKIASWPKRTYLSFDLQGTKEWFPSNLKPSIGLLHSVSDHLWLFLICCIIQSFTIRSISFLFLVGTPWQDCKNKFIFIQFSELICQAFAAQNSGYVSTPPNFSPGTYILRFTVC